MTTLNYDDTVELFSNLKNSIDTFRSKNYHLELSGVFSMDEILKNCLRMEIFLSGDFEQLWRIEHEYTKELRKKLEIISVEVNKNKSTSTEDSFDDMPELIPLYCDDMPGLIPLSDDEDDLPELIPPYCANKNPLMPDDDMPGLIPLSDDEDDMPGLIPLSDYSSIKHDVNEAFCNIEPYEYRPESPTTIPRSNLWNWPAYNPMSALMFNQQVRDL